MNSLKLSQDNINEGNWLEVLHILINIIIPIVITIIAIYTVFKIMKYLKDMSIGISEIANHLKDRE